MYACHVCMYVCMYVRHIFHCLSTLPRLGTQMGRPHGAQVKARTRSLKIVPTVCCFEFDTSLLDILTNRFCSTLHRRLFDSVVTHHCSNLPSATFTYNCTIVLTSMYVRYVCMRVKYVCMYVCICRHNFLFLSTLPRLGAQIGRPHGAQVEARTRSLKVVPKGLLCRI